MLVNLSEQSSRSYVKSEGFAGSWPRRFGVATDCEAAPRAILKHSWCPLVNLYLKTLTNRTDDDSERKIILRVLLDPFDFPAVALKAAHQGDPFVSTGMTRR